MKKSKWQPPETAPKDRAFLICTAGPQTDLCYWDSKDECFRDYFHKQKISPVYPFIHGWREAPTMKRIGNSLAEHYQLNGWPTNTGKTTMPYPDGVQAQFEPSVSPSVATEVRHQDDGKVTKQPNVRQYMSSIMARLRAGETPSEIAKDIGCAPSTIRRMRAKLETATQ
jgi:hypothetical protein